MKLGSLLLGMAVLAAVGTATTQAGVISYTGFTGDADCGISAANTYTAAVHFTTGSTPVVVNGVSFTGVSHIIPPPTNTAPGLVETAINGDLQFAGGGSGVGGNIGTIMNDISYNNGASPLAQEIFTLTGLTAGNTYDLRLYVRRWAPGNRFQSFSYTGDGTTTTIASINEDDASSVPGAGFASDQAYYISHVFTYDGVSVPGVVVTAADSTASFHDYGLTNQVVATPEPASLGLLGLGAVALLRRRK